MIIEINESKCVVKTIDSEIHESMGLKHEMQITLSITMAKEMVPHLVNPLFENKAINLKTPLSNINANDLSLNSVHLDYLKSRDTVYVRLVLTKVGV